MNCLDSTVIPERTYYKVSGGLERGLDDEWHLMTNGTVLTHPMTRISHSYRLFSSTRPMDAAIENRCAERHGDKPAENPSTGCLVSSTSCRRRMRVFEAVGVAELD